MAINQPPVEPIVEIEGEGDPTLAGAGSRLGMGATSLGRLGGHQAKLSLVLRLVNRSTLFDRGLLQDLVEPLAMGQWKRL
jgi:hypothetical protein